ncbi:hypothetical protein ACIG5E_34210 [Kitasatospora sp. NPDC053057]|uniref:hypothetical protein n=1 Tax=Kitasatospora sp. NPDC053057 TaxID=3364062 RepID=UPI0037C8918D
MRSLSPLHAPVPKSIRLATVQDVRRGAEPGTYTEEDVELVLVEMTNAQVDEWEWLTEAVFPWGSCAPRGTMVYEQADGKLLGIMFTAGRGTGWHVEHYDPIWLGDYEAVPFAGPKGTARTERMALQQLFNARRAAGWRLMLRQQQREAERAAAEQARRDAEQAEREAAEKRQAYYQRLFAA